MILGVYLILDIKKPNLDIQVRWYHGELFPVVRMLFGGDRILCGQLGRQLRLQLGCLGRFRRPAGPGLQPGNFVFQLELFLLQIGDLILRGGGQRHHLLDLFSQLRMFAAQCGNAIGKTQGRSPFLRPSTSVPESVAQRTRTYSL